MAGGTQPGKGIPELLNEIRERLEQGYHAMKIKVGGATIPEDVKRVEAALKVVAGSRNLAVDANGAFDRSRALAYAEALAPFKLRWFEEPDRSPTSLSAEVTANYEAPIGSGEESLLPQDVENLVRFGGLRSDRDILQIDVPQSYGIVQFSRTLAMLEEPRLEALSDLPPRRQSDDATYRGRFRARRMRSLSGRVRRFRRLRRRCAHGGWLLRASRPAGDRVRSAEWAMRVMRELAA